MFFIYSLITLHFGKSTNVRLSYTGKILNEKKFVKTLYFVQSNVGSKVQEQA